MNAYELILRVKSGNAKGGARRRSVFSSSLRIGYAFLLAGAVAGCASRDGARVPGPTMTVTNAEAMVLPPPGGPAIVTVLQHNFSNAVSQDIFLFTSAAVPGQNVLSATFFGPVGLDYDDRASLPYASVRNSDIDREMRRQLPGIAMARNGDFVQNSYGPFNYALGRSRAGDNCLYAWQQIRSDQNARAAFANRGTIQIRLRLCDARATAPQLLSVMYGLTVVGTFPAQGWNPFGGAPTVDPRLGRPGNPIFPGVPANPVATPPAFKPQAIGRQAAPAATVTRVSVQPVEVRPLPPVGPIVPLPGSPPQPGSSVAPVPVAPSPAARAVTVPVPACVAGGAQSCK